MNLKFALTLSRSYLVFATAVSVICLGFGAVLIHREDTFHVKAQQAEYAAEVHRIANEMKQMLFDMELVAQRLATFASGPEGISDEEIEETAGQLVNHNPDIISVAVAPGMRVTHVSPLKGNEKVIGIEYWQLHEQYAGVARAFRERRPVFVGPMNLFQGGRGYILRYPVFLPSRELDAGKFWGIVSIVLAENGLIRKGKLTNGTQFDNTKFALREIRRDRTVQGYLYGGAEVFDADPVVETVSVVGGIWEIGAVPRSGWDQSSPKRVWLAAIVLMVTSLLVSAILTIRYYAMRSQQTFGVLSQAVESLDEGFLLFDRENRLMLANKRVAEYYRIPREKLKPGLHYDEIMQLGVRQRVSSAVPGDAADPPTDGATPNAEPADGVHQLADGRWLKSSNATTPEGFTVGIRSDISVQKSAQLAAEAATRQQSEFLSTVSHELRTPLTAIAGRAAFLANAGSLPASRKLLAALQDPDPDGPGIQQLAVAQIEAVSAQGQKIVSASELLLHLVNDLLDWAKAEGSELKIEPEVLSASDIATAIVDEMKSQAQAKGLSLICMSAPARVMADPARLRQVLYNLVGNAIKFTDAGMITLTVRNKGSRVIFGVEDTGIGIAQENLDLIFERFKQVDGSDTRSFGGFGLGLTIARRIVELHDGRLTVTSKVGEGSRFEFDLPKASAAAAQAAAKAAKESQKTAERSKLVASQEADQLALEAEQKEAFEKAEK